jgi:gluconolactonase
MRVLAHDLEFPEGPVSMPDGSIYLVEIAKGTLTCVSPGGKLSTVSEIGGGPNGAALGPDNQIYICNNGGLDWSRKSGKPRPTWKLAEGYTSGRIEVIDPHTGKVRCLYDRCGENRLCAPNDLVFDTNGGFWFTDSGKQHPRHRDYGALYWARADGSEIRLVAYHLEAPNGIGLSPDGKTLYVAETASARVWSWEVAGSGEVRKLRNNIAHGGRFIAGSANFQRFDSLKIAASGKILVATIVNGGITEIWPDGSAMRHHPLPDTTVTNLCFGGPELRTAFVTLAHEGMLMSMEWHEPGLRLNFQH